MTTDTTRHLLALLHRRRANRRYSFVALAILVLSTAGVVVDAAWTLQQFGEPVRWFPFVGLAAVAGGALWLLVQLLREDQRLVSDVKELVQQLEAQARQARTCEGEPYRVQAGLVEVGLADQAEGDERGQMEELRRLNSRLSKALVLAGVLGGAVLAWTLLTAVDWARLDLWGALGLAAVTGLCVGLAAWWKIWTRNRR